MAQEVKTMTITKNTYGMCHYCGTIREDLNHEDGKCDHIEIVTDKIVKHQGQFYVLHPRHDTVLPIPSQSHLVVLVSSSTPGRVTCNSSYLTKPYYFHLLQQFPVIQPPQTEEGLHVVVPKPIIL